MKRFGILLLCLGGCTTIYQPGLPPVTTFDSPLGGHYIVGPPPPPALVEPPLSVPSSNALPTPPELTGRWTGTYRGWASIVEGAAARCPAETEMVGFRVRGDRVQYGRLGGRIGADGRLAISQGATSITGVFVAEQFQGQISTASCRYVVTLERR